MTERPEGSSSGQEGRGCAPESGAPPPSVSGSVELSARSNAGLLVSAMGRWGHARREWGRHSPN